MTDTCKQCGYIHPIGGECLVMKAKKSENRGTRITTIISKLMDHLSEAVDWKEKIEKIEAIIGT